MKKEETIVSTLPIKPQQNINLGLLIGPTIMDFIGNALNIEKNMGFNVLHTYANKSLELNNYITYLKQSGIEYDSIFVDKDHDLELLDIVYKMYKDGLIKEKLKPVIRCSCGMVDMINSIGNNAKLYTIKNNTTYCNNCGEECKKSEEECLVFHIDELVNISLTPMYLKKEIEELSKNFINKDILVSKVRKTGYTLNIGNKEYNIDVDFLWSNYFKLYEKTNQIYIASNHQIFNMYLMNYLAKKTSNKALTFVASPYIKANLKEAQLQYEKKLLKEYKALLLLYNLKWKNKDCIWDDSIMNYLMNISDTKLKNLYKSMLISTKDILDVNHLDELLFQILNNKTNMQKNIKTMKKLYKDGKL